MPDSRIVAEVVECALSQFLADSSPETLNLQRTAATLHALPLYLDWSGCLAIQTSGQIIYFDYDMPDSVRIEEDPRIRNMALFQGSKKYPNLHVLVPIRPPDATECPHCNGKGELPESMKNIVCYCGGLGWLPPTKGKAMAPEPALPSKRMHNAVATVVRSSSVAVFAAQVVTVAVTTGPFHWAILALGWRFWMRLGDWCGALACMSLVICLLLAILQRGCDKGKLKPTAWCIWLNTTTIVLLFFIPAVAAI
jgi:hypothetical protein